MKTKNVRVRIKDIKFGAVIYTAHPFFGIRKAIVKSLPYMHMSVGLFYDSVIYLDGTPVESTDSISDNGIGSGNSYNDRKSFFKEKQAINYMNKMKTDKGVIARQKSHMADIKQMEECFCY